jgi:hypothetical protein
MALGQGIDVSQPDVGGQGEAVEQEDGRRRFVASRNAAGGDSACIDHSHLHGKPFACWHCPMSNRDDFIHLYKVGKDPFAELNSLPSPSVQIGVFWSEREVAGCRELERWKRYC